MRFLVMLYLPAGAVVPRLPTVTEPPGSTLTIADTGEGADSSSMLPNIEM